MQKQAYLASHGVYSIIKETCLFTVLSTEEQPCLELMSTRWEALSVQLLVNIQRTRFCGELVNDKRHQEVRLFVIYLEAHHTGGLNFLQNPHTYMILAFPQQ
jgi:hypothetical protein